MLISLPWVPLGQKQGISQPGLTHRLWGGYALGLFRLLVEFSYKWLKNRGPSFLTGCQWGSFSSFRSYLHCLAHGLLFPYSEPAMVGRVLLSLNLSDLSFHHSVLTGSSGLIFCYLHVLLWVQPCNPGSVLS